MVKIITDSVSDIPKEYIDRYDIKVLPLKVIFGDEVYRDGIDIDTKTMFDRLKAQMNIQQLLKLLQQSLSKNSAKL